MANRYWVGGSASWDATAGSKWALTSGGAGGQAVPTAADDVFFDAASGAVTITQSGARVCKSLNNTGFTGTFAGSGGLTISGDITLGSGATYTNTSSITVNAASTVNFNGKTWGGGFVINAPGATVSLSGAISVGGSVNLSAGTLTTNNNDIVSTAGSFLSTGSSIRVFNGGSSNVSIDLGVLTLTGSNFTNNDSGVTWSFGAISTTINMSIPVSGVVELLNRVEAEWLGILNGEMLVTQPGSVLKLGSSGLTLDPAAVITLPAGDFTHLRSNVLGTQRTLTQASGSRAFDRLIVSDINFTGGATFAASRSIDGHNNSGITITPPNSLAAPLFGGGVL